MTDRASVETSAIATWPTWRAFLARVGDLASTRLDEVRTRRAPLYAGPFADGKPVHSSTVLLVVLQHELWKHPRRHPGDDIVASAAGDEAALSSLLAGVGWPRWRIHRILRMDWQSVQIHPECVPDILLTPMTWVYQLGAGSNLARDVARGTGVALARGRPVNEHIACIRAVRDEPPRQRMLVLRESGHRYIVEDGNHFVVGGLLSNPPPWRSDGVAAFVGRRTANCRGNPVTSHGS